MAEPDEKEEKKASWKHGLNLGPDGLREEVLETRKKVAEGLRRAQAELDRQRAVLAKFGRR